MAKLQINQVYDELNMEYEEPKIKGRKYKNRKKRLKKFKEEKAK